MTTCGDNIFAWIIFVPSLILVDVAMRIVLHIGVEKFKTILLG